MPNRPYQQRRALTTLNQPLEISPALAKIIGNTKGEAIPRKEVIKRLYAYIKEQNLQDPKEKRYYRESNETASLRKFLSLPSVLEESLAKIRP